MKLKKIVLWMVLKIMSIFLIFTKVDKEKITFISLESDKLEGDFRLLSIALQKQGNYKLNYILVKFEKSLLGNIKYFCSCIHQMFAINSSQLVILDYNNYVVSNFKRSNTKVLQVWHASGAIKKFGNDVYRDYKIANYDYAITNCEYYRSAFASAFGVKEEQVIATGIAKTDRLFKKSKIKKDRKLMYEQFPQLEGKKVILYAPTFRGKLMHGLNNTMIDLNRIKDTLGDEYVILYKMHPLVQHTMLSVDQDILCCNGMSIKRLFSVTDYLISDYSAIIIDFSVFEKPMLFYVPDIDEYRSDVGFYIDYEQEMPGPICYNEDEVIKGILEHQFDEEKIKAFKNKFFKYKDGKSTQRVIGLINKIMGGDM